MNKKLLFDFLYVILIIAVIGFMIWLFFYLKSESAMCLKDPIEYYTNKTNQFCYCVDSFFP